MSNKSENIPVVAGEEKWMIEPTKTDISVEGPEIDNGYDLQDMAFRTTKLDEKAFDRNETIINSVRSSC